MKIIHRSKVELERLRYHENWVNAPIDAPLTSQSHRFWFDRWIFKFHTFLEIGSQNLFRGVKINLIRDHLKVVGLEGPLPCNSCWGYKRLQTPPNQKKKKKKRLSGCLLFTWTIFELFSSLPNTKNTSKPIDSSFHQKYKVVFIPSIFLSLVPYLGFKV